MPLPTVLTVRRHVICRSLVPDEAKCSVAKTVARSMSSFSCFLVYKYSTEKSVI